MGIYINPKNESKESWANRLALSKTKTVNPRLPVNEDEVLLCLVDNRIFTALAVMYSQSELEAFNDPLDGRPKVWYTVSKSDLKSVLSVEDYERL